MRFSPYLIPMRILLVALLGCTLTAGCGSKSKKRRGGDPGGAATTHVRPIQVPQVPPVLSQAGVSIVAAKTLPILLVRNQVSIEQGTGRGLFSFDFACEEGERAEDGCGHFAIEDLVVGLGAVPGSDGRQLTMDECKDVAVASAGERGSVYLNLLENDSLPVLSVADLASPGRLYDERYAHLVLSVANFDSNSELGACRYFPINIARPEP